MQFWFAKNEEECVLVFMMQKMRTRMNLRGSMDRRIFCDICTLYMYIKKFHKTKMDKYSITKCQFLSHIIHDRFLFSYFVPVDSN